jgi:hypothetical protein
MPRMSGLLARPGLRLKQLLLVLGAAYLGVVALTNVVNLGDEALAANVTVLNSHNTGYVASLVGVYSVPGWLDELVVVGAAILEAIGALLFLRAALRFRGGGTGRLEAFQALLFATALWGAFILGTELVVAYDSQSTFRELLAVTLLMAVVVAVVPDDPGAEPGSRLQG